MTTTTATGRCGSEKILVLNVAQSGRADLHVAVRVDTFGNVLLVAGLWHRSSIRRWQPRDSAGCRPKFELAATL
jgi:hypothetical protein